MVKFFSLIFLGLFLLQVSVFADHVNGYYRQDGTYVQSYERSSPNSTVQDNYSYKGNTNPYTGSEGSNYYRNSPSSQYYGTGSSSSYGSYGSSSYGSYGN